MSVTGYGGLSQIDSVDYEGHGSIYGGDQGQSCVAGGDCSYTGFSQAGGQSYLGNIGSRGAVIGANGQSYARKLRTNSHLTLMTRLSNISRKGTMNLHNFRKPADKKFYHKAILGSAVFIRF